MAREICYRRPGDSGGSGSPFSGTNEFEGEHQICREDAVPEYPQSGERISGRPNIVSVRAVQPNRKRFTAGRIMRAGGLRVGEYVLSHDGRPYNKVGIMEFVDGKVARETRYFGDPFDPAPLRAQWAGRMP
jgi:hypothetical protein